MIIRNSSVNMAAQSDYSSETSSTHLSLLKRPGTKSVLDRNYLSDYSGGVSDGLNSEKGSTNPVSVSITDGSQQKFRENLQKLKREAQKQQEQQMAGETLSTSDTDNVQLPDADDDWRIKLLKELTKMLKHLHDGEYRKADEDELSESSLVSLKKTMSAFNMNVNFGSSAVADVRSPESVSSGRGTMMVRQTLDTYSENESEEMTFVTAGTVETEDGRSIDFGLSVGISRSYAAESQMLSESTQAVLCDPLVINTGSNLSADVKSSKISFDLNSDGVEENMSALGENSAFLSLDKNANGKIDNGSELFGTKSGDGFSDLAAYDEDGNGFIDEADTIFTKLSLVRFNEDGTQSQESLLDADVGAIYLGSAKADYHLNDAVTNNNNAVIRSTGMYLKEKSGQAGTIQHVDMAI